MKKALIYTLSLALVLSLTACHKSEPEQPTEPTTTPAATSESAQEPNTPEQLSSKDQQDNVGLIEDNTQAPEPEELSGNALIAFFKLAYKTSDGISYLETLDEKIDFEIEVLEIRAKDENKILPADYADQYRAWRPVEEAPATSTDQENQQVSDTIKNQNKTQNQNQTTQQQQQGQTQTQSPQNQGTTQQQSKPSSSNDYDPYRGYGSYEAYIDHVCQELPDLSREEIIRMFPDPAGLHVDEAAKSDAELDLLEGN